MSKTNVLVWYKANGEIVAIGRTVGKHKVSPIAGENQFILETEAEEADLKDLPRTHVVDTQAKKLAKHKAGK